MKADHGRFSTSQSQRWLTGQTHQALDVHVRRGVEDPPLHRLHSAITRERGRSVRKGGGIVSQPPARQLARLGRGVSIDFPIASGPRAANPGPWLLGDRTIQDGERGDEG